MRLRVGDYEAEFTLDEAHQILKKADEFLHELVELPKKPATCVCGHAGYMHGEPGELLSSRKDKSPPSGQCAYDTCSCKQFRDQNGP